MRLFIEPSDVLFFRTALPFTAGESFYAASRFPPTPETIQGAIRSRIASSAAAREQKSLAEVFAEGLLKPLIGDQGSYGRFRLRGLTLGQRTGNVVEQLFPPPAHLLRSEEKSADGHHAIARLVPLPKDAAPKVMTNWPKGHDQLRLLQRAYDGSASVEKWVEFDHWLTGDELRRAFAPDTAELQRVQGIPPGKLYEREPRLGIGMVNESKTTKEGQLYQVSVVRLHKDVGLLVDVGLQDEHDPQQVVFSREEVKKPLGIENKGWLALGGERRAASFVVLGEAPAAGPLEPPPEARACLYFVTPTYFKGGWEPKDWLRLVGARPIAAAVPHQQLIGGWKQEPGSAGGAPKTLRRCVPAGSVYFFDGPVAGSGPFTDEGSEIGYGIAYKGAWENV